MTISMIKVNLIYFDKHTCLKIDSEKNEIIHFLNVIIFFEHFEALRLDLSFSFSFSRQQEP